MSLDALLDISHNSGGILDRKFLPLFANEETKNTHTHILGILLIKLSICFDMMCECELWINLGMSVLWIVTVHLQLSGSCHFENSYCHQLEMPSSSRRNH